ncbi:MAG: lipid A phosphoethanolamine transferase [Muribaculaceae bacterium]|nr:lipid A phosphoethanolamine transferase [Muribaculaceae bacterium]
MTNNYNISRNQLFQQIIFFFFLLLLALPNFCLAYTERVSTLTKACNIIFPLGIYWLLLTLAKKPGKSMLALFLLLFFGAFQMVLLYLFGESVIAVDMFLNLTTTNSSEATELLGSLLPAVIFVVLLYGGALVLSLISIKKQETLTPSFIKNQRIAGFCTTMFGIALIICNLLSTPRFAIQKDIYPINVCYNLYLAIDRDYRVNHYYDTAANFKFGTQQSEVTETPQIVVLVVGETSRAANFGLYGYSRNTTPDLCQIQKEGNLHVFDKALTQSNTTHKSVPLILSNIDAAHFDDIYHKKGVVTAFKEAGFDTYFISNQRRNRSFIDFFGEEADHVLFLTDSIANNAYLHDGEILPIFKQLVQDTCPTPKFIVIHTYGSHFDYHERYPQAFAYYKPDLAPEAEAKYRDYLVNAYDNSIRYVDFVISNIIRQLEDTDKSCAMIYTSDHGEDIYDDSRNLFLHASPVPTFYQLWIPYMIWTSDKYNYSHPAVVENIRSNIHQPLSSNEATFHTLLSLGNIESDALVESKSLASAQYSCTDRYYLNDHNEPVKISDIMIDPLDITMMASHRIPIK